MFRSFITYFYFFTIHCWLCDKLIWPTRYGRHTRCKDCPNKNIRFDLKITERTTLSGERLEVQ